MWRFGLLAILLAACGQDSPSKAKSAPEAGLERRRVALGLKQTPLRFDRAMRMLRTLDSEEILKTTTARDTRIEHALRIENVFRRARLDTARQRAKGARAFDRAAVDTVEAAAALARDPTREAVRRLLLTCTQCHVRFRKPR